MGMSGAQIEIDQLLGKGLITRPRMISYSSGAARNERNCRSRGTIPRQHDKDRGLAEMLLDSFYLPRVLPLRLSALVALLKTSAAASSSFPKFESYQAALSSL
jgi:hypothetical protein